MQSPNQNGPKIWYCDCMISVQRSCSTMTMNGVAASLINNNSTSCGSVNNLTVPTSQGRRLHQSVKSNRNMQLPVLPRKCKVEKSDKRADTVKLWLIKGMVQVTFYIQLIFKRLKKIYLKLYIHSNISQIP